MGWDADLTGLSPPQIRVGTAERLPDDVWRFTERVCAAGVDVTFEQWDRMIHAWRLFAPTLHEGQQAIDQIGAFLAHPREEVAAGG